MKKKMISLGLFMQIIIISTAQNIDSSLIKVDSTQRMAISPAKNKSWKTLIMPSILIGYGFANLGKHGPFNLNLNLEHSSQDHWKIGNTTIDNYLQFTPALSVYALDAFGVKPTHDFWFRTKIFAVGNIIMAISVYSTKHLTHAERPDKSDTHSFPSGHTATAFLGADFFYQEFKYKKKWWIYSGYAVATTVGALRIINNKHWLSDVVGGAGFGILSNRISYIIFDKKYHRKVN